MLNSCVIQPISSVISHVLSQNKMATSVFCIIRLAMWLQQSKTNYLITNKVDNAEVNHSRIYIWSCFVAKNDVLISVLSVSAIYSLFYLRYPQWKLQSSLCNILTVTEKQIKPQV